MTTYVTYPLHDGYIHNWLVTSERPSEGVDPVEFDDRWRYMRAGDDHLLDIRQGSWRKINEAWAYTEIMCDETCPTTLIATAEHAAVSINGATMHVDHTSDFGSNTITAHLRRGRNRILVHVYLGPVALRVIDVSQDVRVRIPTNAQNLERREKFERVFAQAFLERDVYAGADRIVVRWPDDYDELCWLTARLQTPEGRIYAESTKMLDSETHTIDLGNSHNLPKDIMEVLLIPRPQEYYEGLRFERRLPLRVAHSSWSSGLYGDDVSRRAEVLEFAAQQTETNLEAIRQEIDSDLLHPYISRSFEHFMLSGFPEASTTFVDHMFPLMQIVEHGNDNDARELAAILLDKLLFMLAVNSYKGIYAVADEDDPRLDATAPIARVLWGLGAWNEHLGAPVSLAIAEHYQVPALIQAIALDQPDEMWARQDQAGVQRATYKTPDYMLTSAASWRAIFAPDAIVHPHTRHWPHDSRVAQWHDALIDLRRLPDDDPTGYTQVRFPVVAFDETIIRNNWAFARRGDGYLAITASNATTLTRDQRCLRAHGSHTAWIVQMGRAALDGDFAQFQDAVLALTPAFADQLVTFTTLRGADLAFGWDAPLRVIGDDLPPAKHFENPYCVAERGDPVLTIRYRDYAMQLQFASDTSPERDSF